MFIDSVKGKKVRDDKKISKIDDSSGWVLTDRLHDDTPAKLSIFVFIPDWQKKDGDEKASIIRLFFIRGDWFYSAKCLLDVGFTHSRRDDAVTGSVKFHGSSGNERRGWHILLLISANDISHPTYLSDQSPTPAPWNPFLYFTHTPLHLEPAPSDLQHWFWNVS